jgi:hypothetical protein
MGIGAVSSHERFPMPPKNAFFSPPENAFFHPRLFFSLSRRRSAVGFIGHAAAVYMMRQPNVCKVRAQVCAGRDHAAYYRQKRETRCVYDEKIPAKIEHSGD